MSRFGIVVVSAICLAIASPAEAAMNELALQIAFPRGGDLEDAELGVGVGLTFTAMETRYAGFGVDVNYHYWPASSDYRNAFDRYLSRMRWQVLDSSSWAFGALQMTGHARLVAPVGRNDVWLQAGAGLYRVDYRIEEPNWEGSPVEVINLQSDGVQWVPGAYGTLGFDVGTAGGISFGLDASVHHLTKFTETGILGASATMPDFTTFTLGMHVAFGW